ncbi:MAG: tRNA uridine(34) 5-carboxymethylaminomethyl modification radical SAM/GNAT enzyme Elp3 [Candidatus ainarchaeum sp.]|nr:tRNA uridine(34) 5-carboxymethylaminomethyl modification radical SAM/GNAT enzyme Elp3 [Candidatus ainarchaeum sp.]MDD4662853.1 tRNA uridine(34) 5-carboxymethylaminomethyl modification radical SAM/GNAT enzyme Elp3 [Candidatus ainarchaeum sp.]
MNKKYIDQLKSFFQKIDVKVITNQELQKLKSDFAKKHNLTKIPLTSDILLALEIKNPTKTFVTKPKRTLSGVTVISVMTKPDPCPGKCIYCPTYKDAPKSYTGFEPAAMRGQLNNFDAYKQVKERLRQLNSIGHPTNKLELIVMGGTFPATPITYQNKFIIDIYKAVTGSKSNNINTLKKKAMTSQKRIIGLTFETRPDFCNKQIIEKLLIFGGTRVELGVQTTHDDVFEIVKRGHTTKEVIETTKLLKDSGFKVLYHMMLGLPGSNYKKDLESFKEIFSNPDYCPDMIKIYPCLVTKYTILEKMYYSGEYKIYSFEKIVKLIADIKEIVPKWVRIMRVQRDIPATKIIAGIQKSNLREYVFMELERRKKKCNCIRCREPNNNLKNINNYKIKEIVYEASGGKEYFIYAEKENYLLGFIRLRVPHKPFIKAIDKNTAIVRELHVYGQATNFEDKNVQHQGIGKELLTLAEKYAKFEKKSRIAVISGVGVRKYYEKQGYKLIEPYMIKKIK